MSKLITAMLIYYTRKKGERRYRKIEQASKTAIKYSEDLLMQLIHDSKDSEYGKKYHFDQIKSVEDYKRFVPISEYKDYAEYVDRMIKKGEENVLTSRKIVHYAQSSGSVGVPKNIPLVKDVIDLYSELGCSRTFALAARYLKEQGKKFPHSKVFNLIEITERFTELGVTKGAISSTALGHVRPFLKHIITTPDQVVYPKTQLDSKYVKLLFALEERDVGFMVGAFSTALVDIMVYLTNNWESLVEDVRTGTISKKIEMSDGLRSELEAMLKPNPKRAAELRKEFEKGFDEPIAPRIWPRLSWVGAIGTGTFMQYTENLKAYIGEDMPIDYLLYAASEAIFACCPAMNRTDFLMIPQSGFYEFVPAERDDLSKTLTIGELEVGKDYEIILTNLSGLYRYRIFDVVRVVGFYGESPLIQFVYRKNQVVNLAGEKTTSEALASAIKSFEKEIGVGVEEYSILPDKSTDLARYVFVIEPSKELPLGKEEEYAALLEQKLEEASPAFKFALMTGELDRSRLVIVKQNTYKLWKERLIKNGMPTNQIKPVRVIDSPEKEAFFMGLQRK